MPQFSVTVCVADPEGRRHLARVLASEGVAVRKLAQPPSTLLSPLDLLVYDLAPWDETAVEAVRSLSTRHPTLRILLYHPPGIETANLAAAAAQLPGVLARRWLRTAAEDQELRASVRSLIAASASWLLRSLVTRLLGEVPRAVGVFVQGAVDRLEGDGLGAPRVSQVLARTRYTARTLRRACRDARIPSPKRLLEWLTVLSVTLSASRHEMSIARAACLNGLTGEYVRRLERGLGLGPEESPDLALARAFLAFAEACCRERDEAVSLLQESGIGTEVA